MMRISIMDLNTKIADLTIGQLLEIMKMQTVPQQADEYLYSISELADYLHCSKATAQKIKSSGQINKAVSQTGRKFRINKRMLSELLRVR